MNESAYDITHLLALDAATPPMPPTGRRPSVHAVPPAPPVDPLEVALVRDLQQIAAAHDALVAEYLRGDAPAVDRPSHH